MTLNFWMIGCWYFETA